MFKKILIPLDTSELAERVLDYLPPIVRKEETELVLVSAIGPEAYAYAMSADEPELLARFKENIEQRFRQYLQDVKQRLAEQGFQVRILLLLWGKVPNPL